LKREYGGIIAYYAVLFRELEEVEAEGDVSLKNPGFAAAARNRKAG
jgi:hypothetical protein